MKNKMTEMPPNSVSGLMGYDSRRGGFLTDPQPSKAAVKPEFRVYSKDGESFEVVSKKQFFELLLHDTFEGEKKSPPSIPDGKEIELPSPDVLLYLTEKETKLSSNTFAKGVFKLQLRFLSGGGSTLDLVGVYKEGFTFLLEAMGYYKRYRDKSDDYLFINVRNNVMKIVTIERMKSAVYSMLKGLSSGITLKRNGKLYQFPKERLTNIFTDNQHNIFNSNTCELLPSYDAPELKDTKYCSYFLFSNTIVKVDKEGRTLLPYGELKNLSVWNSHILPHEFHYQTPTVESTKYMRFIFNVANNEGPRIIAFRSGVGYMLNHYNDSSMGQAVILYDQKPTNLDNPEGGTGKGVFAQGLSLVKEMAKIDGKFFDHEDKFRYQALKDTTQIVFLDDLKPSVPFTTFFSALTDGWTIEKKHEKQIKLSPERSPKLLFASNSILGGTGTSDKRRQFILEFSDHYSKQIENGTEAPIIKEHGGLMFDKIGWDQGEWNRFYSFMLDCSELYFKEGLKPYELKGVAANRLIQGCGEEFAEWVESKNFEVNLEYTNAALHSEYIEFYYANDPHAFKQRAFTELLKKFANVKGWRIEKYQRGTHPNRINAFQFRTLRR